MKKTFIILLGLAFSTSFAQTTLSQNTDDTVIGDFGITCFETISGEDYRNITRFNEFSRSFDLNSFGITGDFTVTSVKFALAFITNDFDFTIKLRTTDAPYPNGTLTELASETFTVASAEHQYKIFVDHVLETPVVVPANSELVVSYEGGDDVEDLGVFDPGFSGSGESAPGYIRATFPPCGEIFFNPTPISLVLPDSVNPNDLILTVTGTSEEMGTFEINSKSLAVYPNPSTDVINVTLKNSEAQSVEIVNVAGQTVSSSSAKTGINTQNISSLTAGVYILRVKDNKGVTHVSKFVKK